MRNILQTPQFKSQKSKAGFDMSQRRLFTCMPGQLLPCYKDFLNPGDKVKINSSEFVRTEAIESAAFVEMSAHVDWFFVPMQQLYQFWNEFYNSVQDVHTSLIPDTQTNEYSYYYLPTSALINGTREWIFHALSVPADDIFPRAVQDKYPNFFNQETAADFLNTDEFGQYYLYNFFRLSDMLEYGVSRSAVAGQRASSYPMLDFLAYHRIFYSHYNDSRFFKQEPYLYNVDYYHGNLIADDVASKIISTIHYRPYIKDYFTNISPSPVLNSTYKSYLTSTINGDSPFSKVYSSFLTSQGYAFNPQGQPEVNSFKNVLGQLPLHNDNDGNTFNQFPLLRSDFNLSSDKPLYNISSSDIRYLFALDRILQITQYSGSSYQDQTKAHFGYSVPSGISREAYFLGSFVTPININEVVATATTASSENTQGSVIGDIAGKGFAGKTNGNVIQFEAPCHGVLMAIHSISVRPLYASVMCNRLNMLSDTVDFYHPEFDNLGLQPVFINELFGYQLDSGFSWQYRYSELKDKYDLVHQSLSETFRSIWQVNKQTVFFDVPKASSPLYGSMFSNFFIAPQVTNSIFAVQVPYKEKDSTPTGADINPLLDPNEIYKADNFLVNIFHNVHKLSIMSLYSLPKLS